MNYITRPQAEALLTLAEALEACERVGVILDLSKTACDAATINISGHRHCVDDYAAMSVRLAVNDLVPRNGR